MLANEVSLDYDQVDDFEPHHYAFMASESRGTYLRDPNGHLMEILTPGDTKS